MQNTYVCPGCRDEMLRNGWAQVGYSSRELGQECERCQVDWQENWSTWLFAMTDDPELLPGYSPEASRSPSKESPDSPALTQESEAASNSQTPLSEGEGHSEPGPILLDDIGTLTNLRSLLSPPYASFAIKPHNRASILDALDRTVAALGRAYGADDHGERERAFQERRREWSAQTFGAPAGPWGALNHLAEEVEEAISAWAHGTDADFREEMADCGLLLDDALFRAGITPEQHLADKQAKHLKNEGRSWSRVGAGYFKGSKPELSPPLWFENPRQVGWPETDEAQPRQVRACFTPHGGKFYVNEREVSFREYQQAADYIAGSSAVAAIFRGADIARSDFPESADFPAPESPVRERVAAEAPVAAPEPVDGGLRTYVCDDPPDPAGGCMADADRREALRVAVANGWLSHEEADRYAAEAHIGWRTV